MQQYLIFFVSKTGLKVEGIEGYAQYDNNSDTLTFYEGESVPDDALRLNTGEDAPGWAGNLNTKGVGCGL